MIKAMNSNTGGEPRGLEADMCSDYAGEYR